MVSIIKIFQISVLLEDAEICYKTGKLALTKAILNHIITNQDFAYCHQRVQAYRFYGEYLMESNAKSFESVLETEFRGSIKLLDHFNTNKEQIVQKYPELMDLNTFTTFDCDYRKQTYHVVAKYADREYTQVFIVIIVDSLNSIETFLVALLCKL